ncbi:MAG: hypothetical protein WCJ72_05555 [Chryseobacterium sp.]
MNDTIFNIDFKKLIILWMPTFLRTPFLVAFGVVLVIPLITLYIEFLKARKQNLIRMSITCQKFSMQKRLNDAFDQLERRIRIVKGIQYDGIYLYTEAEIDPNSPDYFSDNINNKMKWLKGDEKPIYLRTEAELYSEYDFIVEIPNTGINDNQLRAEIEYYMLQSKNYLIKII